MAQRTDGWGAASMAAAASIWGGTFVASKVVMTVVPPLTLVALRFALVWLMLRLFLRWRGIPSVSWRESWVPALVGIIGMPLSIGTQFIGTALTSASDGALVTGASPALMALFAAVLLKEPLRPLHLAALTVATAGVMLVIGFGSGNWQPLGHGALAIAAVSWALYSVLTRWASRRFDPLAVLAGACGWGALGCLPFVTWQLPWTQLLAPSIVGGILFITFGSTLLAFALWSWGCARLPARIGGLFMFLQPVVATILAAWILGEAPGVRFFAGGVLIMIGVALAQAADQILDASAQTT